MPSLFSRLTPTALANAIDPKWIARFYSFPGQFHSATPVKIAGFSGAGIWQVSIGERIFALRATPEEDIEPHRLTGLHRLLAHVHSAGITQVALPIRNRNGGTFHGDAGAVWQMETWCQGRADFHARPSPARLAAALQLVARWHFAAAGFVASAEESPWFFVTQGPSPAIRERCQEITGYTPTMRARLRGELQLLPEVAPLRTVGLRLIDLFEQTAPDVMRELEVVRDIGVPLQPCLRDLWHDHILFDGDQVTGLIDPHACRSDSVGTDLSRLLRSLVGSDRPAWDKALQCYEQLRPLTLSERGLIEVLDRSSILLSGMTWLNWICLEKRQFPEPERAFQRMQAWLSALEQMSASLPMIQFPGGRQ